MRFFIWFLTFALPCLAAESLQKFSGCTLVPNEWADGDSFSVRFPDGKKHTVRLYGADCFEMHIHGDDSNARRLRDQRRYFGIDDILTAKSFGEAAKSETARSLGKPFTVYTAFADGRGDARFSRIYGFVVTADGKNLSEWLIQQGLARAFGVSRQLPNGTGGNEWKEQLADFELIAARAGRGAWAKTDWEKLAENRQQVRNEMAELDAARGVIQANEDKPVDINHASRDELMSLPGIGEKTALAIIEARPYANTTDLNRASGIGPATLVKLKNLISVTPP
jgi:DNA uptake protein ComE-like DNA-binding protein